MFKISQIKLKKVEESYSYLKYGTEFTALLGEVQREAAVRKLLT
jgi:hypothetical protein